MNSGRRRAVGLALGAAALVAVALGRRTPFLADDVPAYRQKGPAGAPVVVTEYSDFQCPKCALVQPDLKNLLAQYEGRVRLVFRPYPLKSHRWSADASRAAEAAGLQGRYWEFADQLFSHQKEWADSPDPQSLFKDYAAAVGLDLPRYEQDRTGDRVAKIVDAARAHAEALPVPATPTFFINQRVVVGDLQLQAMGARFIERELEK